MIFVLWLLFTPFHSHGLFIPPSTTATGTTRTPELASLLTTPQVEVGAQIVLDHRTLATWDYIGGEACEWLISLSVDVEVCIFLIGKTIQLLRRHVPLPTHTLRQT